LEEAIGALQPVKIAVEAICREDANLFTADITFKFMLDELSEQKNIFSDELKDALLERRTVYSDVLHYTSDPSKRNDVNNYEIFNKSTKLTITKTLVELLQRPNLNKAVEEITELSEEVLLSTPSSSSVLTLKEKLELVIK
jgi:hypothetical protein